MYDLLLEILIFLKRSYLYFAFTVTSDYFMEIPKTM